MFLTIFGIAVCLLAIVLAVYLHEYLDLWAVGFLVLAFSMGMAATWFGMLEIY